MVSSTASTRIEHPEREAARDRPATETPAVGIGLERGADRTGLAGTCDGLTDLNAPGFREGAK